jgi:Flp pilus assembly pilin Flp
MRHLLVSARTLLRDDRGQDLTEYGLLASLIAIVVMVTVGDVGGQINDFWTHIVDQLEALL